MSKDEDEGTYEHHSLVKLMQQQGCQSDSGHWMVAQPLAVGLQKNADSNWAGVFSNKNDRLTDLPEKESPCIFRARLVNQPFFKSGSWTCRNGLFVGSRRNHHIFFFAAPPPPPRSRSCVCVRLHACNFVIIAALIIHQCQILKYFSTLPPKTQKLTSLCCMLPFQRYSGLHSFKKKKLTRKKRRQTQHGEYPEKFNINCRPCHWTPLKGGGENSPSPLELGSFSLCSLLP